MILFLVSSLIFCIGFVAGSFLRGSAYDNRQWEVLRWDANVFGYRPLILGSFINEGDNVMMALRMNTDDIPEDGIRYTED